MEVLEEKFEEIELIFKIKEGVELHLSNQQLSLKWLAKNHIYMSEDYMSKQFVKITGEKFSAYLNRIRIDKAKELINTGDENLISQVAEQVGLGQSPQYFSQLFKKHTGYLPKEYRKLTRNKNVKKI